MRMRRWAILLTIPLWACASKPESNSDAAAKPSAGATALGVIETPFRIALQIPLCIGLPPLMAPGAAVSAIFPFTDQSKDGSGGQLLASGVTKACGPPYVATP